MTQKTAWRDQQGPDAPKGVSPLRNQPKAEWVCTRCGMGYQGEPDQPTMDPRWREGQCVLCHKRQFFRRTRD